jgi:DNA-binding transcriptional regulator YdaS (Cro superfamily)
MNVLIEKACGLVGGQTALARELTRMTNEEVTQQRVRNWLFRGDEVPTDVMAPIEVITKGEVSRKDFRPDDYHIVWPELAPKQTA